MFGSKKILGLDIGTSSIKIAELEIGRNGAELISFSYAPTPPGCINGGEVVNSGALAVVIQGIIAEIKTTRKNVCIGMWGTSVIVKRISIPRVDKKVLAEQIKYEAEQYIPFELQNISLSYEVLEAHSSEEIMEVLLVAAQNELVSNYSQTVSGAGLKPSIVDISSFALANIFEFNYGKAPKSAIAIVNIGAGVTNFIVVSQGEVVFSRDIPFGGFNFTNEISKDMGITLAEAEALKISAVLKGEVPAEVNSILSATNESLAEEIKNSFEFFNASNTGTPISRIFYTGGSSVMPGLMDTVARVMSLPVEPINPFRKIKPKGKKLTSAYLKQIAPLASTALGLGLRKVGDSK